MRCCVNANYYWICLPSFGGKRAAWSTAPSMRTLSPDTPASTGMPRDIASPPPLHTSNIYIMISILP